MNVLLCYDALTDILNFTVKYGSVFGKSYVVTSGDDSNNGNNNKTALRQ